MLRLADQHDVAEEIEDTKSIPGMTAPVLETLYPENTRPDDLELLCHRIIIDDDQDVHESAPYAFYLNGWPRCAGKYNTRLYALARRENMDVVEEQIEMLLHLYGLGRSAAAPIDLTGDDDDWS